MSKLDRDASTDTAQGDVTLEGAVYGLYMDEDREHPNGTVFARDQKIAFDGLFPAVFDKEKVKQLAFC